MLTICISLHYETRNFSNKLKLIHQYPFTAEKLTQYLKKSKEYTTTELDVLSDAEKIVEDIIKVRANHIILADLINLLDKTPYGWPKISILGVLIDLNKHKLRSFNYNNEKRYPLEEFIKKAQNNKELQSLEIVSMQRIDQQVIVQLREDWKTIFNETIPLSIDGDALFNEISERLLDKQIYKYQESESMAGKYIFVKTFDVLISKIKTLKQISDPEMMYKQIHDQADDLAENINKCNSLIGMMDNGKFMTEYDSIINFVKTRKEDVEHLEGNYTEQWNILEDLLNEENPNTALRAASKIYQDLRNKLKDAVSTAIDRLIKNYTSMYDDIDKIAETNNIVKEKYTPLAKYVNEIRNCQKVSQLKLYEVSIDGTKEKLRKSIMDLAAKHDTEENKKKTQIENKSGAETTSNSATPISIPKNPKGTQHYKIIKPDKIFKTVDDVDNYVDKIREDMKKLIDDDNIVIVD